MDQSPLVAKRAVTSHQDILGDRVAENFDFQHVWNDFLRFLHTKNESNINKLMSGDFSNGKTVKWDRLPDPNRGERGRHSHCTQSRCPRRIDALPLAVCQRSPVSCCGDVGVLDRYRHTGPKVHGGFLKKQMKWNDRSIRQLISQSINQLINPMNQGSHKWYNQNHNQIGDIIKSI